MRARRNFDLFGDFRGYEDFFLLRDIVTEDYSAVRFFMPFDDFRSSSAPGNKEAYIRYRANSIGFVKSRNERIALATR